MNMESFEDIKVLMDEFDPAALLPDLSSLIGKVEFVTRIAALIGPVVLLVMGLVYLFLSPKEANHHFGYRCYHGMGSVEAWRFTQRLAGILWGILGAALTAFTLLITSGFGGKEIMDIITGGFTCVLWQIAAVAVSCVAINLIVMLRYDRYGELRAK